MFLQTGSSFGEALSFVFYGRKQLLPAAAGVIGGRGVACLFRLYGHDDDRLRRQRWSLAS